jgi:UDP-N-acetylglucosamine transferase subunit ALG13
MLEFGTIINGLKNNKKVIAVARLKKYGEHVNDHQLQILERFSEKGYLIPLYDFEKLDEVLTSIHDFVPNKFESNKEVFLEQLLKKIEEYMN